MATTAQGPSRSEFVLDLLGRDSTVNVKQANAAWKQAGREGTISASTFYSTKAEFNKKSAGEAGTVGAADKVSRPRTKPRKTKGEEASGSVGDSRVESNGRALAAIPEVPSRPAPTEDRGRVLDELEDGIDDLIFKLKGIGGSPEILAALRKARRMLYGHLCGTAERTVAIEEAKE
jgi:hypothetical protein